MQSTARIGCAGLLLVSLLALDAAAQVPRAAANIAPENGQHAFDWEIGTWKTDVRRLAAPLTGSSEWMEYTGTSVVREVLGGRANLVELRVEGPTGRIDGASLRLYNPRTGQWNLNYASAGSGALTHPVHGGFRNGRGEFHGQEEIDDRVVLVRFVISGITETSARFEQAYSADGGRTWETNWIAVDTRIEASD